MIQEVKDGWMVEIPPLFFEDEFAAKAFAETYGGSITRSKRVVKDISCSVKTERGITDFDFAD